MEDIEKRMNEMMAKINQQENELKNLRENSGRSAAPEKKPKGNPKAFRKPTNEAASGSRKFHNNSAAKRNVNNDHRNDNFQGCVVEEYHVTRRTYQHPGGGNQSNSRSDFWKPPAPLIGQHGVGNMNNLHTNIFPDDMAGSNSPHHRSNHSEARPQQRVVQKALDQIACDPKVTKVRQNRHPFIVQKAYHMRQCAGCSHKIPKGALFLKHREIEVYPHPKYGWKGMIMSEDYITQFYHLNRACLEKRGFENDYLNYLCAVTVSRDLWAAADKAVKLCGLVRPEIIDTNDVGRRDSSSKPVIGLADLQTDAGKTDGQRSVVPEDGCDPGPARAVEERDAVPTCKPAETGRLEQEHAAIMCESDSDDASDKFELC